MKAFNLKISFMLAVLALFSSFVYSAVPRTINYQGNLSDSSGQPLTGTYNFTFDLYQEATLKWNEDQNGVTVQNGFYSVALGSVDNTLADLTFDTTYTLRITVNGEALDQPFALGQPLGTVPYAFRSKYADFAAGGGSGTVYADSIASGTLKNEVKITTGSIVAAGANELTFLRGDGSWQTPTGAGDMQKATDGLNILQATSTLRTDLNNIQYSTFSVAAGQGVTITGTTIKTFSVIASSMQTGAYENISVGTSSIALGVSAANVRSGTLIDAVKITTGSIVAAGANESTFLRGDGSWAAPAGAGDMTKAVDGLNILQATSTLRTDINNIQYSTFSVAAGQGVTITGTTTKTFSVIASSMQAGAYEDIQVGTATIAMGLQQTTVASYENIGVGTASISLGVNAANVRAGTLIDAVKVTTGSISATGANELTFLRGDGIWETPSGAGDMSKAVDGLNILQATSTLRTDLNNIQYSTFSVAAGQGVTITGTTIKTFSVIASSMQAGAYEDISVGTATIAMGLQQTTVASYENIRVGTATIASGLQATTIASYENISVGTATIAMGLQQTTVASYENIGVGTASIALGIDAANVRAGTLIDAVKVTTGSISAAGANELTFLRGDGSWQTPASAGDMSKAVDGLNILQATSTLRTDLNSIQYSTFSVAAGQGVTITGTTTKTFSVIASSMQAGAYEDISVGTATIAMGLQPTTVASYENIRVGTATIAMGLQQATVASYENIGVGTASIALGIDAANVRAGTLIDAVKVTTGSISAAGANELTFLRGDGSWQTPASAGDMSKAVDGLNILQATSTLRTDLNIIQYSTFSVAAGQGVAITGTTTKTFSVIASSMQAGAYEDISVGTATIAMGLRQATVASYENISVGTATIAMGLQQTTVASYENIGVGTASIALGVSADNVRAGTLIDAVKVTTGSIAAAGANELTFLRGDGTWQTVGAGDMTKAFDGLNILQATSTLRTDLVNLQISTFTALAGTGGISITGTSEKTFSVIASSMQAGAYEDISVGTATIAMGLQQTMVASYENIGVGTATIAMGLQQATVASYENISVGTATIAMGLQQTTVASYENVRVGTATVSLTAVTLEAARVTPGIFGGSSAYVLPSGATLTAVSSATFQNHEFSVGGSTLVTVNGKVGVGTASPNVLLDVNGAVALRMKDVTCADGANDDVDIGDASFVKVAGPTAAFSISGFTGGYDGRVLVVYNSAAYDLTLTNDANSAAANRIYTLGASATTGIGAYTFVYDAVSQRWIVVSVQP